MTVSMEQLELHANNGSSGNTDNGHVGGANASVISNGRNVIPTSTTTGSGNGTTNGVRISNGVNATNNNMIDAQTKFPPWPFRRLVRFVTADRRTLLGEPVDEAIDVGLAVAKGLPVFVHVVDARVPWDVNMKRTGEVVQVHSLLSPISEEQVGTIRATGLNYTDHALELGLDLPPVPSLFFKPAAALAHPGEAIPIPPCAQDNEVDYEVELAIIIGRHCRNVKPENALDYVLGWTCANDLTSRKLQELCSQWGYSKGFDKFCPLGPCIVSTTALPDPRDVTLQTRVNGQLVQSGTAQNMIWHVSEIVAYLSTGTTLAPGAVILTGTPPGIGWSRGAWLRHGDDVRCSISHGIGTLVNTIAYE